MRRTPAAILGGGPSLPEDLKKLPAGTVLISVNDHAFHHCEPHIMVFQDHLAAIPHVCNVLENFDGTVVCPWTKISDIKLPVDWWDANQSSCLATWFALWQGFSPVILCGMDLYQGDVKYCHPVKRDYSHPIFHLPVEDHLNLWAGAFDHCPHPERIRVMSGPLTKLFTQYEVSND